MCGSIGTGSSTQLPLTPLHHKLSPARCVRNTPSASTLSLIKINTFSASRWKLYFSQSLKFSRHGFPTLKQLGRDLNGAITLPTAGRGSSSGIGFKEQDNLDRPQSPFTLSTFHVCNFLSVYNFSLVTGNSYPSRFSPRASPPPVFVQATIKP